MKKNHSLLVTLCLLPLAIFAQWEATDQTAFGTPLPKEAVTMTKVGSKLIVNISGSGIYTSTNGGDNWVADNGGLVGTETASYMMAVGDTVFFSTTSNLFKAYAPASSLAWTKIGTKNVSNVPNNNLTQFAFVDNTLYLGTDGGGIVKRPNNQGLWTLITHPKDTLPAPADSKNVLAMIEDNGKLLVGFKTNNTGVALYNPTTSTWAYPNTGLKVQGNIQNDLALRNDNAWYLQSVRYFYKDGTKIYAAMRRNLKDFGFKAIYSCQSGTYNWTPDVTGLSNKGGSHVLSFAKIGTQMVAATEFAGLSINNGIDWSTNIIDFQKCNLAYPDGTITYLCSNVGVFAYDGTNLTLKSTGLPVNTTLGVNDMAYNGGQYYACTANGVFKSTAGKGSWTRLAANDVNKNVTSIAFSGSYVYAAINKVIHKLNGTVWEKVDALKSYTVMSQLISYTNGGKDYVFAAGEWSNVPVGVMRSDDGGATWSEYFKVSSVYDNSTTRTDGFYNGTKTNASHDSRYITTGNFKYNPTTGTLITGGRLNINFTLDNGATWYSRQPLSIRQNLRLIFIRDYMGATYTFDGSQNDGGGSYECFRGTVSPTIFENAVNKGFNTGQSGGNSMAEYGENLLILNNTAGVFASENNADNWSQLSTGYVSASTGNGSQVYVLNGTLFNRGADQKIFTYDITTATSWATTYPKVDAITTQGASLMVKNNRPGKAYYVVLPEAAPAPSAAQVIAGTDAGDVAAIIKGNLAVTKDSEATLTISGLTSSTNYKVYTVIKSEILTKSSLETLSLSTSSTKLDKLQLVNSIYPIPVKGQLNIRLVENSTIHLLNMVGVSILSTNATAGETIKLDVTNLKSGIYFIEANNGITKEIKKVILE